MSLTARLRALLRRRGGKMPAPPPLSPDEERVILSPGWNGPEMETSANYRRRGLNAFLRDPEEPGARVTLDNSEARYTPTQPLKPHYPDEETP